MWVRCGEEDGDGRISLEILHGIISVLVQYFCHPIFSCCTMQTTSDSLYSYNTQDGDRLKSIETQMILQNLF